MLYKLTIALLVASAAAFNAPVARSAVAGRTAAVSMADGSWRRSYDGKGGGGGAAVASAPAATGEMSVSQACVFMATPGSTFAAKKSFLLEKGVSPFVIAEAACTAPDTVRSLPPP